MIAPSTLPIVWIGVTPGHLYWLDRDPATGLGSLHDLECDREPRVIAGPALTAACVGPNHVYFADLDRDLRRLPN